MAQRSASVTGGFALNSWTAAAYSNEPVVQSSAVPSRYAGMSATAALSSETCSSAGRPSSLALNSGALSRVDALMPALSARMRSSCGAYASRTSVTEDSTRP